MSDPAAIKPISPFAYFWIALSLLLGLFFYFSFVYQEELLSAGGVVWNFFRQLFSPFI